MVPRGRSALDPYTLENFRRMVMTPDPAGLLPTPSKKPNELVDRTNRILKLTKGTATGPLIGGNLTMIASLMGTPYQPDTTNAIFFLEDVHEEPYRIDACSPPSPSAACSTTSPASSSAAAATAE